MNHEKQRLADIRRRLESARLELNAQDEAIERLSTCVSDSEVLSLANALDAEMSRPRPQTTRLTAMLA